MQAARGTPVAQPGTSRRLLVLFAAVALVAYAADQVSKVVATRTLDGRPDVQVVGELLQLHLTFNPGAAFSTGTGITPVITVIAILATLGVLWYVRRVGSALWAVALGVLLAGVAGNLTDRLLREPGPFRGHVVDFLMLPNWPVFNIADVCINVAAVLIIVQAFRGVRIDGTREGQPDDEADADGEAAGTDDPADRPAPAEERAE
ncbi:signal peptidase II [Nocardioides marinquilinus]|uniref:signal peptidase II n=1 Tax=Nocardioides marinquilinus TaxID=1210400 RepID=UPI0031EE59B6